jgi:protein gp37
VIVGGESGPGCRPMRQEWVQEILLICSSDKVPLFFKQWGGSREALIRIGRQR